MEKKAACMTVSDLLSKTGSGIGSVCFLNDLKEHGFPQITRIAWASEFEVSVISKQSL